MLLRQRCVWLLACSAPLAAGCTGWIGPSAAQGEGGSSTAAGHDEQSAGGTGAGGGGFVGESCNPVAGEIVLCPTPIVTADASPFPADGGSKDVNWTWDEKRGHIVWGTGDYSSTYANDTGNTALFSHDLLANTWTVVNTICQAAGSLSPHIITDRGPMVYDSKRDAIWLMWADPYPDSNGQPCTLGLPEWPKGSTWTNSILKFDLTSQTWSQPVERQIGSIGTGHYDTAGDQIIYVTDGNGCGELVTVGLGDPGMPESSFPICHTPSPAWPGPRYEGGWEPSTYLQYEAIAYDDVRRRAWLISYNRKITYGGEALDYQARIIEVDIANRSSRVGAIAPVDASFLGELFSHFGFIYNNPVWDSVNERVIWPVTAGGPCARLTAMLAYDPAMDAWETLAVPNIDGVHAGSVAFDPLANAVVMAGTAFCEPPASNRGMFLYRYPGGA